MGSTLSTNATGAVRQYSLAAILAVWFAAAAPMAVLAWIIAPAVAGPGATDRRFTVILIGALTVGLMWQCVRLWLWTLPFVLGFAVLALIPFGLTGPSHHDFGAFLTSDSGRPQSIVAGVFLFAYPTRRFHSAWMGILIHSAQSIALTVIVLSVVAA